VDALEQPDHGTAGYISGKLESCSKIDDFGPVWLAESWLKLAGCVREKHCLAEWMNSAA